MSKTYKAELGYLLGDTVKETGPSAIGPWSNRASCPGFVWSKSSRLTDSDLHGIFVGRSPSTVLLAKRGCCGR